MKRFFAIILASVLLLTACGKQVTTHHIEDKHWEQHAGDLPRCRSA